MFNLKAHSSRGRPRIGGVFGFTLIELLVVLIIISITTTFACLTIIHNQKTTLKNQAALLKNRIRLAEDEAILFPATIALKLTPTGYQFLIAKNDQWQPLSHYALPHSISLHYEESQITISENGELTPFSLKLSNSKQSYLLTGESNGDLHLVSS